MALNLSSPSTVRDLAESLRESLGRERVDEVVRLISAGSQSVPPLDVLRGFHLLDSWLEALAEGKPPPQLDLMLRFCAVASTVANVRALPGADSWLDELRSKAFQRDAELFYESLFEGEFADYWMRQVSKRGDSAKFGPPSGHPDVWVSTGSAAKQWLPAECKRIRPRGEKELELGTMADTVDAGLIGLVEKFQPMKAVVWLHRPVEDGDAVVVLDLLAQMAPTLREASEWRTSVSLDRGLQVSVAALGADGEFQPPGISVTDVEARPILIPRAEMRQTEDGLQVRMKSVLSVRSDHARDRLGNVRSRVRHAIWQLRHSADSANPGIVSVRIRPPRDHGDLYETDSELRAVLVREKADHVAVVAMFWNEGERKEDETQQEGMPATAVTAAYHLKPYFVVNPRCRLQLPWDSHSQFFGDLNAPVVRDPGDGGLKPVDPETMAVLQDGGDLPPMLQDALSKMEQLDEEADSATSFVDFAGNVADAPRGLLSVLNAGRRQFRCFIESSRLLRTIEIQDSLPVRVCTIDLREWSDAGELCWVVRWEADSFEVGIRRADDSESLWVKATWVKQPERVEGR